MDEDVLQTIFVQYIGIALCNRLKYILENFVKVSGMWEWSPRLQMTHNDEQRREYYIGANQTPMNRLNTKREALFLGIYLLCQLPRTQESLFE